MKEYVIKGYNGFAGFPCERVSGNSASNALSKYMKKYEIKGKAVRITSKYLKSFNDDIVIMSLYDFNVELVGGSNPMTSITSYHITL